MQVFECTVSQLLNFLTSPTWFYSKTVFVLCLFLNSVKHKIGCKVDKMAMIRNLLVIKSNLAYFGAMSDETPVNFLLISPAYEHLLRV